MFNKLDKLIKSVAALDVEEQKAILRALDVYEETEVVEQPEAQVEEEQVAEEPKVEAQPQVQTTPEVTEPTGQASDNLFAALQAQLDAVLAEVKGLKEQKEVLESEKKELEEKQAKQPFGIHGKVQTKDTPDVEFDVEKMYQQNLKRY